MKTTQHTPGPWRVEPFDTVTWVASIEAGNCTICDVSKIHKAELESRSNAHLIAAAPELLEACKALTHYLEADADDEQEREDYAQAMAAISKAQGKE